MKPKTAKERVVRRKRKPVGATQLRLEAPVRPGYVRRWVSDIKNRLIRFEEGGWAFVQNKNDADKSSGVHAQTSDSRVRQVVDRAVGGQPIYGYLMEIERALYDEDQATKASELSELDEQLRGGVVKGAHPGDTRSDVWRNTSQGRGISVQVGKS